MNSHLMDIYAPLPITFKKGRGTWLWDENDKMYLDALSGFAVCCLGHSHPKVVQAIQQQSENLIHTSNLYRVRNQAELATVLCHLSGLDKITYANTGAEAVEIAIKLMRAYGHSNGIKNPIIVVMDNAYHGRSLATLSASGKHPTQPYFQPLLEGFIRVPYNDAKSLESIANNHSNIVGVLLEPIQGSGGIVVPDNNYLTRVGEICKNEGWLLALDEVQTGMGRTGTFFAYQASKTVPDILILAKGLGSGMPIGACLASEQVAKYFTFRMHNSTFAGNPLATAAAIATIKEITNNHLTNNVREMGRYLFASLNDELTKLHKVKSIRGKGLMLGIELNVDCKPIIKLALKQGLLIGTSQHNTLRLLPPLNISKAECEQIVTVLRSILI